MIIIISSFRHVSTLYPPHVPISRAQVKPKKVAAHNLVADILKCAFTMIVEPPRASGDYGDDDADEEQGEDPQVCFRIISFFL